MSAGRIWPAEWRDYQDLRTGVTVRQLTDYKGHSHHLYFTNPGWYDGGRRLIFASDRENRTNLFSLDLTSGDILQLTDLASPASPRLRPHFQQACLNPIREEVYFCHNDRLMALDLRSLHNHSLWEITRGFRPTILSCTADGKHVCLGILEDLSERLGVDFTRTDVGFWETWAAKPQSRIVRIATDGDGVEVLREEQTWIGHVNTSPTQANLLTFCHEGPWLLCEHDSSSHIQEVHVHPRFTPDGKGVLFTSDLSGYGNLYLAELPEFDSLPAVSTKREFSMARAGLL